jgi:uncharacterized protein YggE
MDATPQVAVRGEAVLQVEPEVADLDVSVRMRARNRETAIERCIARQQQIAAVVRAAGDAVESAETGAVTVHLEYHQPGTGEPVASQYTRLRIGDLTAIGDLVAALGRLDDVDVNGPSWGLRPDSPVYERARLAAVADAVGRARSYAAAFGAELTGLVEVSDPGSAGRGLRVAGEMAARSLAGGDMARDVGFEVTPMRTEVHAAVEVRFAMSEPEQEVFRG